MDWATQDSTNGEAESRQAMTTIDRTAARISLND
jgi:hypothetical protein